jgi:hypothetical protein
VWPAGCVECAGLHLWVRALANAAGSVDLIADLAGYYSPQSTQAFYPVSQLRVLDTATATHSRVSRSPRARSTTST